MAEPTLTIGYDRFTAEVGRYLGYTNDSGNWSADQLAEIEGIVNDAVREFYHAHPWNFLQPKTTLAISNAADVFDLPDDFSGFIGTPEFQSDNTHYYIQRVDMNLLLRNRAADTTRTGKPLLCALEIGDTYRLAVWPKPDADYTLVYQYEVAPNEITSGSPNPYGTRQHGATILQGCLAMAELRDRDENGPHWQKYQQLLADSKRRDSLLSPRTLGYNGDSSDMGAPFDMRNRWCTSNTWESS